ncbi:MAG: shikimate kinase [Candidatus Thorarchaeota archaeon]|nr:shikimate kinase [Candidatus Thorarchaeota archaeon]
MKNIALIGFMGTGKTVVGQALSSSINRPFVDTDLLIQKRAGKTIRQIFDSDGEQRFRDLESEVIEEVSGLDGYVISHGGGAVLRPENRWNIRKNSIVILLRASATTVFSRVSRSGERPLLTDRDRFDKICSLLRAREELYYKTMDLVIDTDSMTVLEVVEAIRRRLSL